MRQRTETPQAVYIHIPFCANKCHYCDFNSYVLDGQPVDEYLDALEREMAATVSAVPPQTVRALYIGGGTPTVLTARQLERLLKAVRHHFPDWSENVEFTVEANPGTVDPEKLRALREGGVNRLSFGAQSFDDGLLAALGRTHSAADVERSVGLAREAGFGNLSIDLMFGLPRQSLAQLERTLDRALSLELPHYSAYALKIEEHTLFHALHERGELPLPDEDEEWEMYRLVMERLRGAGYVQYEISNFARPGFESRHNAVYWRNESYYGLGAGAHGYVRGVRHVNVKGVQAYIEAARNGLPALERREVTEREAMEDFMMLGMRLLAGVTREDFRSQFGREPEDVFGGTLERLLGRGLIEETARGWRLSEKGIPYGNEVFGAFLGVG